MWRNHKFTHFVSNEPLATTENNEKLHLLWEHKKQGGIAIWSKSWAEASRGKWKQTIHQSKVSCSLCELF